MRILAAIVVFATVLSTGCTSLMGRSRDRDRDRDRAGRTVPRTREPDRPWWEETAAAPSRTRPGAVPRPDRDGIIAGELFDADEGRRLTGRTFISIRPAEEITPAGGQRGVGVETDEDGFFFMPGLVPGKTYILSVVREIAGRRIAGEAQVKPPAGNVRIELSADRVSSVTPPLPPPPGMGPFERAGDRGDHRPPPPGAVPSEPRIEPPATLRPENIAGSPALPPTAAIPAPPSPNAAPPGRSGESGRPEDPRRSGESDRFGEPDPTSLRGQRVPNFIISDILGSDWEFRYASGRLILMQFWSTSCVPCQRAIPIMKRLQADYGGSGLEIVALACEPDAAFLARARDVEEVARRKELNYRVYLEREGRVGEVQKLFGIQWVPTLILLDRQGTILWRGGASETELSRLEDLIRSYLTRR